MLVILTVLLGVLGYINTGSDLYPPVNIPVIVISTSYPGAGSEEIQQNVVKPIEDAVSSISGVDVIQSTAREGAATTVIQFKLSADTTNAYIDTQKAIDGVTYELPKDANKPTLFKVDPGAIPVIIATVSGNQGFDLVYNDAKKVKERIEKISGVGQVSLSGGMDKELQINIDKTKLDFYGLTISQIVGRLQAENLTLPGGTIQESKQDKVIKINGEFKDINQIKMFRIPTRSGFVQLKDIADVSLVYPKAQSISRTNGKICIGLTIQKQTDANIVKTVQKIKTEIEKLKPTLDNSSIDIAFDTSIYIKSSLDETQRNLIEGIFITSLILLLFLRQFSSMIIVLISIPLSLIATFFMMFMFKFSFNMISLMGLALCVGILVDDSVVILENIHRHMKMGKDPKTAALDGRTEIGMAAIAITLCDIVVFAPIAFMSGIVGQYFRQFGLTVVFATLFSLIISFTVTPMLASRMYKNKTSKSLKENALARLLDKIGKNFTEGYINTLKWSLKHRVIVCISILFLFISAFVLIAGGFIGTEFMPVPDTGEFAITLDMSPGTSIDVTNEKTKIVEDYLSKNIPELQLYYTEIGGSTMSFYGGSSGNKATISVKLVNKKERKRNYKQVMDQIRTWGQNTLYGVKFKVADQSGGEGGPDADKPVLINIKGPKLEVLRELANQAEKIVKATPGTVEITNSLQSGQPELTLNVDRLACANYGFTVNDISSTIRASLEGVKAGVFRKDGQEYDIKVKVNDNQIVDPNDVINLKVANATGSTATIGQLASISYTQSPAVINTQDKQRLASITAYLKDGYNVGVVNAQLAQKIKGIQTLNGYSVTLGGAQESMDETFTPLVQALIMSVALVYIVLAILYESFLTPFVRLLALPVGFIGSIYLLFITHNTLNMFSMIGLIMLDGLAAKNGTLLIDYTNTLMHRDGLPIREALIQATRTRLKPIYMTSIAMIVGMLPTALAIGDGSEYKAGMGVVIIGGIITSTILSPILLPVAYTLMVDMKGFILRKIFRRKQHNIGGIKNEI
jgi:HAE1 family hydrophobic/amphiphilic exporter-1